MGLVRMNKKGLQLKHISNKQAFLRKTFTWACHPAIFPNNATRIKNGRAQRRTLIGRDRPLAKFQQ
jgi:hypothetical protein